MNNDAAPFLTLEHITVRYLDKTLFTGLSWEILEGQQWAVTGNSGAGKSALLNAIAGKFNIINGGIHYHFYDTWRRQHTVTDPYFNHHNLMALVAHHHNFRNRSNTTDFYYQQRFNSMDAGDAPTVQQYLYGDAPATPSPLLQPLRIDPLLGKELIKLSNGETRRVMIAKALLQQPLLLMLDSPFTGLDVQARKDFMEMVNQIIANSATVILVTTPAEIPANITHVLTLDNGRITGRHTREAFLQLPQPETAADAGPRINEARLKTLVGAAANAPRFDTIVHMENVRVQYGDVVILDNINWTVKRNEKWALLGPNGAGKSTLLSLINADNPQAYANRLYLFDRKRGSGESIWDIKRKIGFVSPELHQYFPARSNCLQVVCTGFHDIIGQGRACTPEQTAHAAGWMEILGIDGYSGQPFKHAPESIQRLTLLARALVKDPPLLIFDEPCQGLDARQKQHFKQVIDALCRVMELTLIFVTHYQDEIPDAVNKVLRLEKGKIAEG